MTGAKLAALVCKHMRAVCRLRRRLLKNKWSMDGGDASSAPTGLKAMKRNELQHLCVLKGLKANGKSKDMAAALEASNAADGMVLDFKSLSRKGLQRLCKLNKLKANDKPLDMVAALETSRCSAVALILAGGAGVAAEVSRCSS